MKRSTLVTLLLIWGQIALQAQTRPSLDRCITHFAQPIQPFENWLQSLEDIGIYTLDEVYRIPVVIHILHFGEPIGEGTNLSEEVIQSQMTVINQDFRRVAGTRGYNEHPAGADSFIEFVLAEQEPEGNPTTGILRIDVSKEPPPQGIANSLLLNAYYSMWNPEHYLNIWSMPWLPELTLLGEARFPESDLPGLPEETNNDMTLPGIGEVDGVVVNAHHFGQTGKAGPYSLGRTLTHELGHFLGLFHTWGPNDPNKDGCELDDFCQDTPPTRERVSGCPTNLLACDGRPAMVENYMDYADDACMNIFTRDQISRMRTVLENSPRRKSLLNSPALKPVLEQPKDLAAVVSVYPNPATDRIMISFENHLLGNVEVQLHDINGQLVLDKQFPFVFREQIELMLPKSQDRMLFLTLTTNGHSFRQKIMLL